MTLIGYEEYTDLGEMVELLTDLYENYNDEYGFPQLIFDFLLPITLAVNAKAGYAYINDSGESELWEAYQGFCDFLDIGYSDVYSVEEALRRSIEKKTKA